MPTSTATLARPKMKRGENLKPRTLSGIRSIIPKDLFLPNPRKAFSRLALAVFLHAAAVLFGLVSFSFGIPYLYPLVWVCLSFTITSLFVIGHDCAHGSFLRQQTLNHWIGQFCFLFSLYPFYAWKFSHNAHHAHTNERKPNGTNVYFDNAWLPFTVEEYLLLKKSSPVRAFLYKATRYFPPLGSFLHNIVFHAFPSKFTKEHRTSVYFSYVFLGIGLFLYSAFLFFLTGDIRSLVHIVLIPALGFQFWMSYYTYLHHTTTDIGIYEPEAWNPYLGQIVSTYNVVHPKWLSFLHFHIDIHTPHHLSTAIPCYHLPAAWDALKQSEYARDLKEGRVSLRFYLHQILHCHLWDVEANVYRSFGEVE